MAAVPLAAPCSYSRIRVMLHYTDNYNTAYFNGLFLHKEEFGQSFSYDSKGSRLTHMKIMGGELSVRQELVYKGQDGELHSDRITSLRFYFPVCQIR